MSRSLEIADFRFPIAEWNGANSFFYSIPGKAGQSEGRMIINNDACLKTWPLRLGNRQSEIGNLKPHPLYCEVTVIVPTIIE